ncbi:MAG: [FeFe] hydrogenase H-cluster maturation GTPase HydF [Ruminococcaceae bacterium]|nr:[FeFe] hydrogenase H-cluster maturation GTPase HydF [Oscillospiraceae bacterium]
MGLNDTPSADRIHIGFFGRRNAGKSSLVNAVTGQDLSVVSEKKGTTTDPVTKSMELLPLGPVVIIDTPGFDDDEQELGSLRVQRTKRILNKSDIAVLVIDAVVGLTELDQELIQIFQGKQLPYLVAYNKVDQLPEPRQNTDFFYVSAKTGTGIHELKEKLGTLAPKDSEQKLIADLLNPGDLVVLVTPIDESAPKGRMILPQVQMIRDILDANAFSIVVKETELAGVLDKIGNDVRMVVTDSQVFKIVSEIVPENIPLTSFSILMARYKGFLETAVDGVSALQHLQNGNRVLIAEGCTHHRQCNDIGTIKIPNWLRMFTGNHITIDTCSGTEFPDDLSPYKVVLHCGGCMLNEREVQYRMKCAVDQQVPFLNYGLTIACMQGILKRSLQPFPELAEKIKE